MLSALEVLLRFPTKRNSYEYKNAVEFSWDFDQSGYEGRSVLGVEPGGG